jgi:hypothetical protein
MREDNVWESTHKRYGCHKEGMFRPFVTDKRALSSLSALHMR